MDFRENKLFSKYKEFCNNGKIISHDFIKEFLLTYIDINNYHDYVREIRIYNTGNSFAVYTTDKALSIRYNTIIEYAKVKYGITNINNKYDAININNEIIKILCHELTHIEQKIKMKQDFHPLIKEVISEYNVNKDRKIKVDNPTNIYNKLTVSSNGFKVEQLDITNNEKNLYKKYHDFFPYEYNANLEGLLKLIEFEKKAGLIDNSYQTKNIYIFLLKSYIVNPFGPKSPLETINELKDIKTDLNAYKVLSEYERILYGLPVENETLEKILKIKNNTQIDLKTYFNK